MPRSQQPIKGQEIMIKAILSGPCKSVLDVGAGDGKWGELLKGRVGTIIGLEVWGPCITANVMKLYDYLILADVREPTDWTRYDVVILGDVLEHLPHIDAVALIETLKKQKLRVFLTIPIGPCEQEGEVYDNPFEEHLEQWTHEELVAQGFKLLHRGFNEAGTVEIGTYILNNEKEHKA